VISSCNRAHSRKSYGRPLLKGDRSGRCLTDLKLNDDGKRSRKAPIERLRCNRQASGLAKGVPSNFNAKATLVDHVSTEMGRKAFMFWLTVHREELKELKRQQARAAAPAKKPQTGRVSKIRLVIG
jgi:hypothetical protein